jgi:RNA polymerase sigma-70 factor (ECF subfamily)
MVMDPDGDAEHEVSDEALLAGVAIGDDVAVLRFVRRYQRRLFGLARSIVGDPSMAEDVAQEAFVRILRHASVFDPRRGSVASWTLTITRNLAIDALRVRRPSPAAPLDALFVDLVSAERSPEDEVERRDAATRALVALASLPRAQRRAVVLAAMHGRTATEVAQAESIPLGTAKSRIRLGMERLRASLLVEEAP